LHNLTLINGKNCEKVFGDRDRRAHRRQDKQRRTRDARNGQLKSQIAQFHGFILSLVRSTSPEQASTGIPRMTADLA